MYTCVHGNASFSNAVCHLHELILSLIVLVISDIHVVWK